MRNEHSANRALAATAACKRAFWQNVTKRELAKARALLAQRRSA